MSAFLVDQATIDVILETLKAAVNQRPYFARLYWRDAEGNARFFDRDDAADESKLGDVGRMLLAENVRSLRARYPESYEDLVWHLPAEYAFTPTHKDVALSFRPSGSYDCTHPRASITASAALKNVDCYEYQACESEDWEQTEAYRFCQALKERIAEIALRDENAPWGWTDRHLGRDAQVSA